jgi:SET domain-containing protein
MPQAELRKLYEVRRSAIHGRGVFATETIPRGERIIEYRGQRVSWDEAMKRPDSDPDDPAHTFLFEVDDGRVIDARVRGNAARWINHSCDPNCEAVEEDGRIFIDAIRTIAAGEELGYDYSIGREKDDPPDIDEIYACRCGSPKCRGTMIWPPRKTQRRNERPRRRAP